MKSTAAIAVALVASASAFAPATSQGRAATQLYDKPFFNKVFDMDLFAPNPNVNDYGARSKKGIKQGKLTDKSYVPDGLTKAQYEKFRAEEEKKKADNYARNVAKAGKFLGFNEFYQKRGTDLNQGWVKSATKGHEMVKTKYDWSGKDPAKGWFTEVKPKK
jgi:hypothetical protein